MGKEIENRRREVMIGIHQARAARHDAVPVGVGVVAEGDVEAVLEPDQLRHGVGRRAVHADLAVPVQRHEAERRIHRVVHDLHVDPETFGDRRPERYARSAERIDADLELRVADGFHVHDRTQVGHVRSRHSRARGCVAARRALS